MRRPVANAASVAAPPISASIRSRNSAREPTLQSACADSVTVALRNRTVRAPARRKEVLLAVPGEQWPEVGQLGRRVATGEHLEHRGQGAAGQVAEGVGPAHERFDLRLHGRIIHAFSIQKTRPLFRTQRHNVMKELLDTFPTLGVHTRRFYEMYPFHRQSCARFFMLIHPDI